MEDYESLKAAVADYLGRDDLTARIPFFIRLAEKRLERDLRLRAMERRSVADVDAGDLGATLPARRMDGAWDVFLEMRDLSWRGPDGRVRTLRYMPPDRYREEARHSGTPSRYTVVGDRLFFAPVPDTRGQLLLTYYAEIPPLSAAQPCNAVLKAAPDAYLYAALVESAPYTRSSAPLELWTQFYSAARRKLEAGEQRARFSAEMTMRPARRI